MLQQSPFETIAFVCGIVMCVIGVASFVTGVSSRARQDGMLTQKVDSALQGIEEIKNSLKDTTEWRESTIKKLESHEQKINTLSRQVEELKADRR